MTAQETNRGQTLISNRARNKVLSEGQALIIILLVLAVASTIVLSLISRTTTDIAITTKEKEASRAFSAAEAGVEEALVGGPSSGTLPGGETYQVQVGAVAEGATDFPIPQKLLAGETLPVWFVSHADDGTLTCSGKPCFAGSTIKLCWGDEGTDPNSSTAPALEVAVLYAATPGNYGTIRVARTPYDPNSARRSSNNFSAPDTGSCTISGVNYAFGKNVNFSDLGIPSSVYNTANGLQTARLRLFYNTDSSHSVGVNVGNPLPAQGTRIESTGLAEQSTRKVEVFELYPDLPPIFDFAVFGGSGDLTK